ncbi:MAG: DNA-binding response regulator [Melioribacteraceae bacterium]|nr:MAG: DNA-binding response regulator [Melioribacteraceae bacterium]
MNEIRLFVVEDNVILRKGVTGILSPIEGILVSNASTDDAELLDKLEKHKANVVLLTAKFHESESRSLINKIKTILPNTKIIVMQFLTAFEDIFPLLKYGVSGFILKDASVEQVIAMIRRISAGETILLSSRIDSLFAKIVENALEVDPSGIKKAIRMTWHELKIISLLSEGLSNSEIAREVKLSKTKLNSTLHKIMEKLTLHTNLEVVISSKSLKNVVMNNDPERKDDKTKD